MCEFARTPAKREHSAASIPPSRLRLPTSLYASEALAWRLFISFYPETYFLDSLCGVSSVTPFSPAHRTPPIPIVKNAKISGNSLSEMCIESTGKIC